MATRKERGSAEQRPVSNANFLVDLALGDPESYAAGFSEVLLPPLRSKEDAPAPARLVLRRGVTGALDLYAWWDESSRGQKPLARDITITLLAADRAPVMRWRFSRARPVALSYSPLRASEGSVMMETLEIAFDAMQVLGSKG